MRNRKSISSSDLTARKGASSRQESSHHRHGKVVVMWEVVNSDEKNWLRRAVDDQAPPIGEALARVGDQNWLGHTLDQF